MANIPLNGSINTPGPNVLLNDENRMNTSDKLSSGGKVSSLFSTAKGSRVTVSTDSIQKAKSVLNGNQQNGDPQSNAVVSSSYESHKTPMTNKRTVAGTGPSTMANLSSLSSKCTSQLRQNDISNKSASFSDSIVSSDRRQRSEHQHTPSGQLSEADRVTSFSSLLKTARGNSVRISKDALERTKSLFASQEQTQSFDYNIMMSYINDLQVETPIAHSHATYSASSTKSEALMGTEDSPIYFNSDQTYAKAAAMSDWIENRLQTGKLLSSDDRPINRFDAKLAETLLKPVDVTPSNQNTGRTSRLFQRANGGDVSISHDARLKSLSIFRDSNNNSLHSIDDDHAMVDRVSSYQESDPEPNHRETKIQNTNSSHSQTNCGLWRIPNLNREALLMDDTILLSDLNLHRFCIPSSPANDLQRRAWTSTPRYRELLKITSYHAKFLHFPTDSDFNIDLKVIDPLVSSVTGHLSSYPLSKAMRVWVALQLRWIIWTLASYERKYPELYFNKLLTWPIVLYCISRRYSIYNGGMIASPLRPSSSNQITPVKSSHVSARSFFRKAGVMSHLQRCCEILIYHWPMILCFSIQTDDEKDSKYRCRVSDGWWSADVSIDSGITAHIRNVSIIVCIYSIFCMRALSISNRLQGKLKDGTKVIVFAATIQLEDRIPVISISLNNIRKVRDDAKLGFCQPKHLTQALSIKSLAPGESNRNRNIRYN